MYRASVHRWIAALALVAILGLAGAQPAAAANLRAADRFAGLWSAVAAKPAAFWEALVGWLGGHERPSSPSAKTTWGIDPNGNQGVQPGGSETAADAAK